MTTGRAYDNALLKNYSITPEELLFLSCVAPRKRLGIMDEADFSVLSVPEVIDKKSIIDSILFQHDNNRAVATYVRGKKLRLL